jgi:hypothetical protein
MSGREGLQEGEDLGQVVGVGEELLDGAERLGRLHPASLRGHRNLLLADTRVDSNC